MMETTGATARRAGSATSKGGQTWATTGAAWTDFAQHKWAISRRTFYNYVGTRRDCRPRRDGLYHADDIVKIATAAGWPPRVSAGAVPQGGEGGATAKDVGLTLLEQRLRRERIRGDLEELELRKKRGELVSRGEMERMMSAGVAVLESELLNWIHSEALEIISLVDGNPKHEALLIDMLRERSRVFLNGFALDRAYEVEVIDEEADAGAADGAGGATGAVAPGFLSGSAVPSMAHTTVLERSVGDSPGLSAGGISERATGAVAPASATGGAETTAAPASANGVAATAAGPTSATGAAGTAAAPASAMGGATLATDAASAASATGALEVLPGDGGHDA
ncbi:hypothetical protein [Nitratidesulfovibrio vulgaris]|uniref:Uncharacterized protein n=1 Tax=Nitratidesulfovibrio vulgaris (strain ATCC 29579 / DSM 644 / CCUG 34227 / NCIMB 8303 / VKM B-1760 / Hildenborough) TaxID=882 RepID=Q72A11_NITV2|nr:hypothetical protein [Nitratidesulfovibrio vulgaris]AAS96659.1 hypothetical protein DVU_2186 [Nitratidesulfovibrio vulgaris str. Hildenborough]ADP87180.1 hypothetical protein Deval_2035 [Nitratidesulfovibrio vulgaris RCH1]